MVLRGQSRRSVVDNMEGVLSAQFKGVHGLVQHQALQGQEYHCQRDSTVQLSSKRSCFSLLILPHALVSFMGVTALSTGVSGIIAANMYRRKELLPASGFQGQKQSIFHVAVGGYERKRMSLKPSDSNLHPSWWRASQWVLRYWALRTGMKNKSWSFATRWRNGGVSGLGHPAAASSESNICNFETICSKRWHLIQKHDINP